MTVDWPEFDIRTSALVFDSSEWAALFAVRLFLRSVGSGFTNVLVDDPTAFERLVKAAAGVAGRL